MHIEIYVYYGDRFCLRNATVILSRQGTKHTLTTQKHRWWLAELSVRNEEYYYNPTKTKKTGRERRRRREKL